MQKKDLSILIALYALIFTSIQCTQEEQKRSQDRTGNAINNAFDATKNVLRNVANGIDNAVYR